MKNPKPEPVVVNTVCSLCGEAWAAHGAEPTTLDCIRLLKAKAAQPIVTIYRDRWVPTSYPVYPVYPVWYGTVTSGTVIQSSNSGGYAINATTTAQTPAITATCQEVAA